MLEQITNLFKKYTYWYSQTPIHKDILGNYVDVNIGSIVFLVVIITVISFIIERIAVLRFRHRMKKRQRRIQEQELLDKENLQKEKAEQKRLEEERRREDIEREQRRYEQERRDREDRDRRERRYRDEQEERERRREEREDERERRREEREYERERRREEREDDRERRQEEREMRQQEKTAEYLEYLKFLQLAQACNNVAMSAMDFCNYRIMKEKYTENYCNNYVSVDGGDLRGIATDTSVDMDSPVHVVSSRKRTTKTKSNSSIFLLEEKENIIDVPESDIVMDNAEPVEEKESMNIFASLLEQLNKNEAEKARMDNERRSHNEDYSRNLEALNKEAQVEADVFDFDIAASESNIDEKALLKAQQDALKALEKEKKRNSKHKKRIS